MKRILTITICAVVVLGVASVGWGIGTPAGTLISNTATATYDVGAATNLSTTASTSFLVDEVVDVTVTMAAASTWAVIGTIPELDQPLYFAITNNGNGSESYALTVDNSSLADDFDPVNPRIVIDTVNIGSYDGTGVGGDTLYVGPTTIPADTANNTIYAWVLNDILDTSVIDGDVGQSALEATSTNASGGTAPGTIIAGAGDDLGDGPSDAVLGAGGGTSRVTGAYVITQVTLMVTKSIISIVDTLSTTLDQPIPGAEVTFGISVMAAGTGSVQNVFVTDPIPTDTTYLAGSLFVNGVANDDSTVDGSGYNGGTDEMEVTLGTMNGGAPAQTIRFTVNID